MNRLRNTSKQLLIALTIFVQSFGFSLINTPRLYAQEAEVPSCPVTTGAQAPTGAGSQTFTFRPAGSGSPECVWENAYYFWSPATKAYTPRYDTHVCDPVTDICERVEWVYISAQSQYVEQRTVVSVPTPPPAPTDNATTQATTGGGGGDAGTATQNTSSTVSSGNGTDSTNSVSNNTNTNVDGAITNNASVLTTLDSNATSGDASALFNTTVGDVSTGDAAAIANILNMIQSTWDPSQGDLTVFSADLLANYYGDLLLDPSIVLGNGTGSNNDITNNTNQNLTLNVTDNATIENDINLNAISGDATANGNTTVGDVSTGDAHAVANVINMINSMIQSGQSFIGSLNIHGDLNGDILLPQSIMDILLGNGTGANNSIANAGNTNVSVDSTSDYSITNNTDLGATTGNAGAEYNTTVGNLSTGNAETNVNEMNLIGQNVQNSHGLLVFVNVLGTWVGMLFGAPGTSAISAGNGTNSSNNITNSTNTNADINYEQNFSITNNLNLNATSGDATANANTTVGNVSSGNATSSANILNMINSTMNFTDWFGVLFINVFGSWDGSFGVDTESGERPVGGMGAGGQESGQEHTPAAANTSVGSDAGTVASASTGFRRALTNFVGGSGSGQNGGDGAGGTEGTASDDAQVSSTSTLANPDGSDSSASNDDNAPVVASTGDMPRSNNAVWWITGTAGLFGLLLLGGERLLLLIRKP